MPSLYEIFQKAQKEKFALGAFNACNLETIRAITQVADKLSVPVIVEMSPGESEFMGMEIAASVLHTWKENLRVPLFINLDHGRSPAKVRDAIDLGFDLVHFDGSDLPFEGNIKLTRELVEYAHESGVLVEAEIDRIPETSIPHSETAVEIAKDFLMTDPTKAAEFVEKTGVDVLAVFIGNLHGVYTTAEKLDLERLEKLKEKLPCFLSLHGGSGILDNDIKKAIEVGGVVKINVNTELRVIYRKSLEEKLQKSDSVKMYEVMPEVIDAVQKVVEDKIRLFESARED